MAIKNLIGSGIGFSPGGPKYIVTRGMGIGEAVAVEQATAQGNLGFSQYRKQKVDFEFERIREEIEDALDGLKRRKQTSTVQQAISGVKELDRRLDAIEASRLAQTLTHPLQSYILQALTAVEKRVDLAKIQNANERLRKIQRQAQEEDLLLMLLQ